MGAENNAIEAAIEAHVLSTCSVSSLDVGFRIMGVVALVQSSIAYQGPFFNAWLAFRIG